MPQGIYKRKNKKEVDFNKVLQLVLDGLTVQNAVFSCGWKYTSTFYREITKEQKQQLYRAKILHSTHKRY